MGTPWEHDSPVDDSPLENHGKSWIHPWMIRKKRVPRFSATKPAQGSALGSAHRAPKCAKPVAFRFNENTQGMAMQT